MIEKIKELYWTKIGYKVRGFFTSVGNLIKWFPVIWKDRDWDDHYIFEVFKFKLEKQAKYTKEKGFHTNSDLDAKRMMLCVKLMEKVQEDFYTMEYMDYEEKDFFFVPTGEGIEDGEGGYYMETRLKKENLNDFFKKYPLVYKKIITNKKYHIFKMDNDDLTSYEVKSRIALNIGRYNHERARKLLFKILSENVERWWN
jgi:hypothetical protein